MVAFKYQKNYENKNHRKPIDHDIPGHFGYNKNIETNYTKDYRGSKRIVKQEIFNLEREHKVINPHKM